MSEYGLALEDMAGMLTYGQIVITDQERHDILALAHQMKMDNLVVRSLPPAPPDT